MRPLELAAALGTAVSVLTACAHMSQGPTALTPVCTALIGPIHYNTFKRTSPRYAARQLAPDLKKRNDVGRYLGCPQYRRW